MPEAVAQAFDNMKFLSVGTKQGLCIHGGSSTSVHVLLLDAGPNKEC